MKKDGRRSTHKQKHSGRESEREIHTHMKNNTSAQIKANGAERERRGEPANERARKRQDGTGDPHIQESERERERGRSRLTIE